MNTTQQKIKDETFNIKDIIFPYLVHWKWIVLSLFLSICVYITYIKFTVPAYNVSATLLINEDKSGGDAQAMFSEITMGMSVGSDMIENEIEILKSRSLIGNVVKELGLNIQISEVNGLKKYDNMIL